MANEEPLVEAAPDGGRTWLEETWMETPCIDFR